MTTTTTYSRVGGGLDDYDSDVELQAADRQAPHDARAHRRPSLRRPFLSSVSRGRLEAGTTPATGRVMTSTTAATLPAPNTNDGAVGAAMTPGENC